MEYENDGLTRSIKDMLRMTGIILFGAWNDKYKQPKFIENGAQESKYQDLLNQIDRGEINEAENDLLELLDQEKDMLSGTGEAKLTDSDDVEMALCVYGYMNDKEDAFLHQHNYSREEIEDGVKGIMQRYGIFF